MKPNRTTPGRLLMASSLIVGLLAMAGCGKQSDTQAGAASDTQAASAAVPYTPPSADQLYQMVAPIALFPDKLVAQVLAGATYPDQITAADAWLAQNPSLKGDALQQAANAQPWDVSVKSLTAFPAVLDQMAKNLPWTTALGEAYVNDPTDVMNAIQVMRQRARTSGNLKTSPRLRVDVAPRVVPAADAGEWRIPPPPQMIEIAPAQPDVVYVPAYDPGVAYGEHVSNYPGYAYREPRHDTGEWVTAGVLTFGAGVAIGAALQHHYGWGWHAWGMNWGGPASGGPGPGGPRPGGPAYGGPPPGPNDGRGGPGGSGGPGGPGGPADWRRPAVVYNNTTYVSRSSTVVNHVVNQYGPVSTVNNTVNSVVNTTTVNNDNRGRGDAAHLPATGVAPVSPAAPAALAVPAVPAALAAPTVSGSLGGRPANVATGTTAHPLVGMTVPHFNAHDTSAGARPAAGFPAPVGAMPGGAVPGGLPVAGRAAPGQTARPSTAQPAAPARIDPITHPVAPAAPVHPTMPVRPLAPAQPAAPERGAAPAHLTGSRLMTEPPRGAEPPHRTEPARPVDPPHTAPVAHPAPPRSATPVPAPEHRSAEAHASAARAPAHAAAPVREAARANPSPVVREAAHPHDEAHPPHRNDEHHSG